MRAVLTGFMASGKSSVGRELQSLLGCSFADLDEVIEVREGKNIGEIFAAGGEKAFREAEIEALRQLMDQDVQIVALGGGTLMQSEAQEILRDTVKVYLRTGEACIRQRLDACGECRPMLQEHGLGELLGQRGPIYEKFSDMTVDTDRKSVRDVAVAVARKLGYGRFLECCCSSSFEAQEAEAGGASRIELCEQLGIGGVTPSRENIKSVVDSVSIPVNVLVRPRGGDFVWSDAEVQEMLESIDVCKALGVNAVVIGALRNDGSVDTSVMTKLIDAARPMQVTFHRAFDVCADPISAFDIVKGLGCDRLLTSGHEDDAYAGRWIIGELVRRSEGRIAVMAGCGVRPGNIVDIEHDSGATEFHSSSHGPLGTTARETVAKIVFNK